MMLSYRATHFPAIRSATQQSIWVAVASFVDHTGQGRYYGADYDTDEVNAHHHDDTHEYVVSRSALECDVFINLPKLKTHKKTGVTLSLKNMVGINGDKNYLPHFTQGTPADGGDEYPDGTLGRTVESLGRKAMRKLAISAPTAGPWLYRQARKAGAAVFGDTETLSVRATGGEMTPAGGCVLT